MGGAPTVTTIRPGVTFITPAADSFRRFEARLGRQADVNSTYRDWDTQLGMYKAWQRYVNSGYDPRYKPNHSRAIHPDYSKHCQGVGWDSDEWRSDAFNQLAEEYGWIRTAANDPTERHHYEYQWWNDKHRNDPVPAGGGAAPIIEEGDMLTTIYASQTDGSKPDKGRVFEIFRDPRTGETVKRHITSPELWNGIKAAHIVAGLKTPDIGMTAVGLNKIPTWKK